MTDGDYLEIHGNIISETVMVNYPIENFDLSSSVQFQDVGLSMEIINFQYFPILIGSFYLKVDSQTVLLFEGTISQGQNPTSAILNAQSYDV